MHLEIVLDSRAVARRLGVTPNRIRQLARRGVAGRKVGRDWVFTPAARNDGAAAGRGCAGACAAAA
mgnify:CR=1 FL=1